MYTNIVKLINFLIRIANHLRMIHCKNNGDCLCNFCTKECKVKSSKIDKLI